MNGSASTVTASMLSAQWITLNYELNFSIKWLANSSISLIPVLVILMILDNVSELTFRVKLKSYQ